MMEKFAMGDYGAYIWSSYALTVIVVVIASIQGYLRHTKALSDIRANLKAMESDN